jgi:hypothetical protein
MTALTTGNRAKSTRVLPDGYVPGVTVNLDKLAKNVPAMLGIHALGLALLVASGWLFLRATALLRPGFRDQPILALDFAPLPASLHTPAVAVLVLLGLAAVWFVGVLSATLLLHELVHGGCMWLFTRARPVIGFRLLFAYASAPGWYMPRGQCLVVGLAPLVLISLVGLALVPLVPAALLPSLLLLLILNAAGAVGDILLAGWLLAQPRDALVRDSDTEVAMTLYTRAPG